MIICYFVLYICTNISINYIMYIAFLLKYCSTHSQNFFFNPLSIPHYAGLGHHHFFPELLKYPPKLSSCFYFCVPLHAYFQHISQSTLSNLSQIMLFLCSNSYHVLHLTHSKRQTLQWSILSSSISPIVSQMYFPNNLPLSEHKLASLHFSQTSQACSAPLAGLT